MINPEIDIKETNNVKKVLNRNYNFKTILDLLKGKQGEYKLPSLDGTFSYLTLLML